MEMNWISVKDRLPPKGDYYACKRYLIFQGCTEIAYWYNDKWVDGLDGFYQVFDPTHWMPLPSLDSIKDEVVRENRTVDEEF